MKKLVAISLAVFFLTVTFILAEGLIFSKVENGLEPKWQGEPIMENKNGSIPMIQASSDQNKTDDAILSLAEASKHNIESDCWLVIRDKVYNVSSFINSHPGGAKKIVSNCGSEVTGLFASIHSNFAWDLLKKYYIGDLNSQNSVADQGIFLQPRMKEGTPPLNIKENPTSGFLGDDNDDDEEEDD